MSRSATPPKDSAPDESRAGAGERRVDTPHTPAEILQRLDVASRRGRLPGFTARPADGVLFSLELHGSPFDGLLSVDAVPPDDQGPGSRLIFRWRMLPQLPAAFALILIATIWPGVYFMDRLIPSSWNWIPSFGSWWPQTWWWYIPLTVLPLPFAWRALMQRSRAAIDAAASEAIAKVEKELG